MATRRLTKTLALFLLAGMAQPLFSATRYVADGQLKAVSSWAEIESKVQNGEIAGKEARAQFKKLWPKVTKDEVPSERVGRWQWIFPLPGHGAENYSADSYDADNYRYFDGPNSKGHPAVNIYVRDRRRVGTDDRTGEAAPVVSAKDGVVVGAQKFWEPGDKNKLGVYACILDLQSQQFFYYCYLSKLKVSAGQLVSKGQIIGWAGRTGPEINRHRLGTHLRFQVHNFSDGLFFPVYPGRKLRESKHLEFPLKGPDYSKKLKM